MKKIQLIGAGRLAWQLGLSLIGAGYEIIQVFSRTEASAKSLADKLNCQSNIYWDQISHQADFYFLCLPDDILPSLKDLLPFRDRFFIHTSGAAPLNILDGLSDRVGVLYPLQTLSKELEVDFSKIPLFIESGRKADLDVLLGIASHLSEFVYELDSENRLKLHLSAVFVNNFTNHMYQIAESLLEEVEIPFQVLFPMIAETTRKVFLLGPEKAQTGPALRGDKITQTKHLEILSSHPDLQNLYKLLSSNIEKFKEHGL